MYVQTHTHRLLSPLYIAFDSSLAGQCQYGGICASWNSHFFQDTIRHSLLIYATNWTQYLL